MLTAKSCLACAHEMERWAGSCGAAGLKADMLSMAESWRYLAKQALWQDAFAAHAVQDSGRE